MTAIETITELFTLKDDLVSDAAAATELSADNEGILLALCRWATRRSGEDAMEVFREAQGLVSSEKLNIDMLREILETGKE